MSFTKRLTDGVLAGSSCFVAADAMAQDVANHVHEPNTMLQILIPVITGVVVPFLKELTFNMAAKHRERRKKRQEEDNNR